MLTATIFSYTQHHEQWLPLSPQSNKIPLPLKPYIDKVHNIVNLTSFVQSLVQLKNKKHTIPIFFFFFFLGPNNIIFVFLFCRQFFLFLFWLLITFFLVWLTPFFGPNFFAQSSQFLFVSKYFQVGSTHKISPMWYPTQQLFLMEQNQCLD